MNYLENLWTNHFKKLVVVSYWLLGLCNNFAYVIMLSAAHDILSPPDTNSTNSTTIKLDYYSSANKTNKYDCNDLSTGTILLADIIPGIIIKLIAPLFVHKIKYWQRVLIVVVIINSCSYLLVALSPIEYKWLIFIGVGCASLSSSFGEITFLSLSTFYNRNLSLSGWGSGTGAAGLIGSFGYAGLTSLGLKPRTTILSMLFIPFLMLFSYIILPSYKTTTNELNVKQAEEEEKVIQQENASILRNNPTFTDNTNINDVSTFDFFKQKLVIIRPLLKYMIPLFLVYFSEYYINQGLFELLYFKDSFIKEHKLQYRWYNVVYQLAVFISRSSIGYIKIKYLYIFPVFQLLNVGISFSQIFAGWMPNIWFVLVLIFWEGLLGGGCYVNAFDRLSVEIDKKDREQSIAFASIADSVGIALAGFTSIPTHNAICEYGSR